MSQDITIRDYQCSVLTYQTGRRSSAWPDLVAPELMATLDRFSASLSEIGFAPNTLIISAPTWVEMRLWATDFGWWPMSFFRRRAARKRWLAAAMGPLNFDDDLGSDEE